MLSSATISPAARFVVVHRHLQVLPLHVAIAETPLVFNSPRVEETLGELARCALRADEGGY